MVISRTIFLSLVVIAVSLSAFSQSKKPGIRKGSTAITTKSVKCYSGSFGFDCPNDYKTLQSGNGQNKLFFAKSKEFRYAVFAVFEPDDNSLTETLPVMLKLLLPKASQDFKWKDVEADPRKSSAFEVESKRRIGINSPLSAYVTLEYRLIDFKGKKLLTGTLVDGFEGPVGIKESFEDGTYTTNGGCFDTVSIIAALTKEKIDEETGPCYFTITMAPGA